MSIEATVKQLKKHVDQLVKDVKRLETDNKRLQTEMKSMQKEVAQNSTRHDRALKQGNENIAGMRRAFNHFGKRIDQLQADVDRLGRGR